MNMISFAPKEFQEHLKVIDDMVEFNKARRHYALGVNNTSQHYVITGNEGVGKIDAVKELYRRMKEVLELTELAVHDASVMFDSTNGFEDSMSSACNDHILLYIKNAEHLVMKCNVNPKTDIEELCDRIPQMKNSIVVLAGRKNKLLELVKGNERARSLFSYIFQFDDLTPDMMMEYILDLANSKDYMLDMRTEEILRERMNLVYKLRGSNFRNAYYLQDFFNNEIIPRMTERVIRDEAPIENKDLCRILPEDIPEPRYASTEEAICKLKSLVGLDDVKKQILDHTALVRLNTLRASKGLFNRMPPMHMVFTGNPGTGKTTIAKLLGEIYHSIGVLSSGHVVETSRSKLVGEYIGVTEKNTLDAINSANGGVLFIDEAYNLFTESANSNDFGMRVIETLLTYLGTDDSDLIVILAGYTNEMKRMLDVNPGMKSRFPYTYNFEDYTPEQLMQIGRTVLEREQYSITAEAERKLAKYVIHEYDRKDEHFGNGRFITRLITTNIIPALGRRLLEKAPDEITAEEMVTIEACDIPDVTMHTCQPKDLDEAILTESLEKLDHLVGLHNAKQALHDYVAVSRLRHRQGILKVTARSLCWDFIGKTGTGKSTVAKILGKIMQGIGILKRGQTVSVNADELIGGDSYKVLERVIKKAKDGLLFLDMDAPGNVDMNISHLKMWIFNKLQELNQTTALVFAQVQASEDMIAQNLATNGIAAYGSSIVFNDFTIVELSEILSQLLKNEYQLDIMPEAKDMIGDYIKNVKGSETRNSPVNARTIFHLTQTIAHITQLRLATTGGEQMVTLQDISHFKWNRRVSGKVGFV